MNKRKIISITLILALSISVFAFGDSHIAKVEAYLAGDLNFNVDGEQWQPKDTDGSDLTPIIYNDRTYIPVRSLLEDKGVTVGYEAATRTVLIDYSTINIKPIDKASPLIFDKVMVEGGGGAGKVSMEELTIKKNPDFSLDSMEMTSEMNFNLNESAEIEVDGITLEGSIDEIIQSQGTWSMDAATLDINEETGEVEKLSISTMDSDVSSDNALKLDIVIEITVGGVTITITVKY